MMDGRKAVTKAKKAIFHFDYKPATDALRAISYSREDSVTTHPATQAGAS